MAGFSCLHRRLRVLLFFCLVSIPIGLVLFFPLARPAHAFIYTVNSLGDESDDSVGAGGCHTALNTCTLRAAIQEANFDLGADTISITATGTILLGSSLPPIVDDVLINGPGMNSLIISGGNLYQVMWVSTGVSLQLNYLSIANGSGGTGGGIAVNTADLFMSYVAIYSNSAGSGGGIYLNNNYTATIVNSAIYSNSASVEGGGIYAGTGSLTLTNTDLYSNTSSLSGGAIANHSNLAIFGGNIYSNTASYIPKRGGGTVVINGVNIYSNTVTGLSGYGGAIYSPSPSR
jgi:CSLREA domain-containing protein